jgi:hypothetical protein
MSNREWMIDGSMSHKAANGLFCFCPIERDDDGNISAVVTGLSFLSSDPPNGEDVIGVYHPEGEEAAIDFAEEFAAQLAKFSNPPNDWDVAIEKALGADHP